MSRESQIITVSVPKELAVQYNGLAASSHMTKSELFRKLLQLEISNNPTASNSPDIAGNLQKYWELKEAGRPTVLIGSVIATNAQGQIIIVKRSKKDEHIKTLSWVFPGGELKTLDFENEIIRELKSKTGLKIEKPHIIGARVIPESIGTDLTVISMYFAAQFKDVKSVKLQKDSYNSIKLINPLDVYSYFTTSTSDEINRYLVSLSQ